MSCMVDASDLPFLILLTQNLVHRGKLRKEDCLFADIELGIEIGTEEFKAI